MAPYRDAFMPCPRCRTPLDSAESVLGCRACRGFWIEEAVLSGMVNTVRTGDVAPLAFTDASPGKLPCPSCGQAMAVQHLEGVTVDRCRDRHGIWFDVGELEQCLLRAGLHHGKADRQAGGSQVLKALRAIRE